MIGEKDLCLTDDDWFSQGMDDALSGRPKQASAEDPCAASQYDLGYNEGLIRHPHNVVQAVPGH
jgi:hypothetical protein